MYHVTIFISSTEALTLGINMFVYLTVPNDSPDQGGNTVPISCQLPFLYKILGTKVQFSHLFLVVRL